MRRRGADCPVVVTKRGNARGAKGAGADNKDSDLVRNHLSVPARSRCLQLIRDSGRSG